MTVSHLLVGIVTNRGPRFHAWLQAQLERQVLPAGVAVDLLVVGDATAEIPPCAFQVDIVQSPGWHKRPRSHVHFTARVPPETPLYARRNLVLEAARALGSERTWLCWVDDDDLLAPTHLAELVERTNRVLAKLEPSGPHDVPWAVGLDEVTVVDAREPRATLGDCFATRHLLPRAFCAFTQSAFYVPRCATPGFEFPGKPQGSDTTWILGMRANYGPPEIVAGLQTYLAIAHGTNRSNDAARTNHATTLRELEAGRAFPPGLFDVRHPAWE